MVYASGTARVKHAETGVVYEIESDMLHFDVVGSEERGMGPEITYSAVVGHPELGQLVWSIWEYPAGAENYRETDVGPHTLLEDVEFGLSNEPDDDVDDEARESRINELVEWFREHYEDPAERLPYESREGGYQWIWGGPYEAREELEENFPDEDESIIAAAVAEIESDGLLEWAPVAKPEDYDQYDEEPSRNYDLRSIGRELEALIASLPEPRVEPAFALEADGLIHLVLPPDAQNAMSGDVLLEELRAATGDLKRSLSGTNAYTPLLDSVEYYEAGLSEQRLSISRLYARGVRLNNAADAINRSIEGNELPPLPVQIEQNLSSTIELHRAYIMSREDGRDLAQGADAYKRSAQQTAAFKEAANQIAAAIEKTPTLFTEEVRKCIADAIEDIGKGPQPERSNQVAGNALVSLFSVVVRVINANKLILGILLGGAIETSAPGAAAIAGGADTINAAWNFLMAHGQQLKVLAAVGTNDLNWLSALSQLIEQLKSLSKK